MQAKDIPDESIIATIEAQVKAQGHPATRRGIAEALGLNEKIVLAKLRKMVRRGLITGCACGCRGDFEVKIEANEKEQAVSN